jgi:hypothetical protein
MKSFQFLLLLSLAHPLFAKVELKSVDGWHDLKWGSSLEEAQAEVKKVLGDKAVLTLDADDNNNCVTGYFYESPYNKKYQFRFLQKRLYQYVIWYRGYLVEKELPKTFMETLTKTFGKRSNFDEEVNKNSRLMIFCKGKWDNKPAEVKVDAMVVLPQPLVGYSYFVETSVDKIADRKTEEIYIECGSGKEYHEPKASYELKKEDFKKDF